PSRATRAPPTSAASSPRSRRSGPSSSRTPASSWSERRSAALGGGDRRLVRAELDDVARRLLRLDPKELAVHARADVHLQLAVADRPRDLGVGLQLEAMLDVEVADHGAVD